MSGERKRRLLGTLLARLSRDRRSGGHGLAALARTVLSMRGEASGAALARQVVDGYGSRNAREKLSFLTLLAEDFGPDPERLASPAVRKLLRSRPRSADRAAAGPPRAPDLGPPAGPGRH